MVHSYQCKVAANDVKIQAERVLEAIENYCVKREALERCEDCSTRQEPPVDDPLRFAHTGHAPFQREDHDHSSAERVATSTDPPGSNSITASRLKPARLQIDCGTPYPWQCHRKTAEKMVKLVDQGFREQRLRNLVEEWFKQLGSLLAEGVHPEDIYNVDKTTFVREEQGGRVRYGFERPYPTSTEPDSSSTQAWKTTVVDCINTRGFALDSMIIVPGQTQVEQWDGSNGRATQGLMKASENDQQSGAIPFKWLREVFHPQSHRHQEGSKRLLIFDGHSQPLDSDWAGFCKKHEILCLPIPSGTEHLLQPLQVMRYHQKGIFQHSRADFANSKGSELLGGLFRGKLAYRKRKTIMSSFGKTGINPFKPRVVLDRIPGEISARAQLLSAPISTLDSEFQLGKRSRCRFLDFSSANSTDSELRRKRSKHGKSDGGQMYIKGHMKGVGDKAAADEADDEAEDEAGDEAKNGAEDEDEIEVTDNVGARVNGGMRNMERERSPDSFVVPDSF